jgi:elongation factor G
MGKVQISYKETIIEQANLSYTFDKNVSGKHFFAKLSIYVEPNERNKGNIIEFIIDSKHCEMNPDFIKPYYTSISDGLHSGLLRGSSLGFPMEDVRIIVYSAHFKSNYKKEVIESAFQFCANNILNEYLRNNRDNINLLGKLFS